MEALALCKTQRFLRLHASNSQIPHSFWKTFVNYNCVLPFAIRLHGMGLCQ